jgi:hypothetical protein
MGTPKGREFERETASLGGKYGKRVERSGAIGTVSGISQLSGDAVWKLPWLRHPVHLECKHGYTSGTGNKGKSMTLYREWFDKHMEQAKQFMFYPMWALKLKFTSEKYILVTFPTMTQIIKDMDDLYLEKCELEVEVAKLKSERTKR